MSEPEFRVLAPRFSQKTGEADFSYELGDLAFTERLRFPEGIEPRAAAHPAFARLLTLAAAVLGVSYYKLKAPLVIDVSALPLTGPERAFVLDLYENGLGEFFARNGLKRFGRLTLSGTDAPPPPQAAPALPARALVPIGGGKDSLVTLSLLERAGVPLELFAVNPKGPILSSAARAGRKLLAVTRSLDPEMIALSGQEGFYNGHVPATAIVSTIAALTALLFGFDRIVLSNERSASEGNLEFDGREANHQYSKSLAFERAISETFAAATGGALGYFSLLRPWSEARIAKLFAREDRFDAVFSSCNANFRLAGHQGPLWCGNCPKCRFVFLIFAPVMDKARLEAIFGADLLQQTDLAPWRELTGLAGHKPWECVGEILEAAACLHRIASHPDWKDTPVVAALAPELLAFYGREKLEAAYGELMEDAPEHLIPADLLAAVAPHAH